MNTDDILPLFIVKELQRDLEVEPEGSELHETAKRRLAADAKARESFLKWAHGYQRRYRVKGTVTEQELFTDRQVQKYRELVRDFTKNKDPVGRLVWELLQIDKRCKTL